MLLLLLWSLLLLLLLLLLGGFVSDSIISPSSKDWFLREPVLGRFEGKTEEIKTRTTLYSRVRLLRPLDQKTKTPKD